VVFLEDALQQDLCRQQSQQARLRSTSTVDCNGTRRTQDQCRSSMCSCQHTKEEAH
jgi:hypothetical protein